MQMLDAIDGRELYTLASAWAVTWIYFADERQPEEFVCLFDMRTRPDYVLRRVEQYYVNARLSLARQAAYADDRETLPIHEQAHYVLGVYKDEIWCGLHPTLYARKVSDLRIIQDMMGREHILWDDANHAVARAQIARQIRADLMKNEGA